MNAEFDVVIIGGGAAGIGAARQLAASAHSTLLLEATSRLGGRAWTCQIAGHPLDLGCGWLHSGDRNSWTRIAEEAGLAVDRRAGQMGRPASASRLLASASKKKLEGRSTRGSSGSRSRRRRATAPPMRFRRPANGTATSRRSAASSAARRCNRISVADYLAYDFGRRPRLNWRAPHGYGDLIVSSVASRAARSVSPRRLRRSRSNRKASRSGHPAETFTPRQRS